MLSFEMSVQSGITEVGLVAVRTLVIPSFCVVLGSPLSLDLSSLGTRPVIGVVVILKSRGMDALLSE